MVRRVGGGLVVACLVALLPSAAHAATAPSLQAQVARALAGSTAPLVGAVAVIDGGPVVDIAGNRPLPPASTQKLYTAATALLDLGPDHRLRTEVRATGPVLPDGTLAALETVVDGRVDDIHAELDSTNHRGAVSVIGGFVRLPKVRAQSD